MTSGKLSEDEIDDRLEGLEIWGVQFGKLATEVEFDSYEDSVLFANQVFSLAEDKAVKPEIKVTDDAVKIDVWTPDIGITEDDFSLAEDIEQKLRSMDLN